MFDRLFREGGLSLERLRALCEVHRSGSIVAAAGRSPSRQSQLSRQLGELEVFFGRALKERQGRRVVLTPAGRRLAEHVAWSLDGLESLLDEPADERALTLAAGDSLLHWLVLPRIARVQGRFAVVGLPAEQVVARLREGTVDVGLVRRDELASPLEGRPLGTIDHALFVPRGLSCDERTLPGGVPLAMQTSDPEFLEVLERLARARGAKLEVALACETFPQVFRAVQSGRYAGVLPTLAGAELPRARVVPVGRFASRLHLAWDPRLLRVRPAARPTLRALAVALQI